MSRLPPRGTYRMHEPRKGMDGEPGRTPGTPGGG